MNVKKIYGYVFVSLVFLFSFVGCGNEVGSGFSSPTKDNTNFINPDTITEEHLIQAKQIDDLLKLDNNKSSDELFLDLQAIVGSNVKRYEDTFEIKFGEMEILINNQKDINRTDINQEDISLKSTKQQIFQKSLPSCNETHEKRILVLFPFNSIALTKDSYHNVYNKLKKHNYCVDQYTENDVTSNILLTTDKYNLIYMFTHSNQKGVLVLNQENKCHSVNECAEQLKNGLSQINKNEGIEFTNHFKPHIYRYINPKFFSKNNLDYRKKDTILFVFGCNALAKNPAPLQKHFEKAGGYGVIGFKTLGLFKWTNKLTEIFFDEILLKNMSIKKAVPNTVENYTSGIINSLDNTLEGYTAEVVNYFTDEGVPNIKTLHLQTNKDYDIYFNPELDSPKNVKVTNFKRTNKNDNITVSWDAVGKATDYKVRIVYTVKDTDIERYKETDWIDGTNTIVSIKKPESSNEYVVKVKARNKYSLNATLHKEENPVSNFTNIIYSVKSIDYPKNLKIDFIEKTKDGDKVRLSWDKVDKATEYQVVWNPLDRMGIARDWISTNSDEFILDEKGTQYLFKVRARSSEGVMSEFSIEPMVYSPSEEETPDETVVTKLDAPKLESSVTIKNGKATLKWNKVENATSYQVYISDKKGVSATNSIASYPSVKTTITIPNIKKGKKYYVAVEAKNIPKKLVSSLSNEVEVYEKKEDVVTPTNTTTPIDTSTLTLQDCKDKTLNQTFQTNTWTTSLDEWNRVHVACLKIFSDNELEGSNIPNTDTNNNTSNNNTASTNTSSNGSRTSIDYMKNHKNEKLASTDCKVRNYQGWRDAKNDLIYSLAPADNMMKSIEGCIDVIKLTEHGGLSFSKAVESVVRSRTKETSPFSDVWDKSATSTPTLTVEDVENAQNNANNSSNTHSGTLTLEKCKSKYGNYTNSQWASSQSSGDYKGEATACYQAIVAGPAMGINGQLYIDQYNNGVYGK